MIVFQVSHLSLLPPATKLRQGNVFTCVCDSVHGGSLSWRLPKTETHHGQRYTPRQRPLWTETSGQIPPRQRPQWTETPLDRDPLGQRPPWTETPLDRDPPEQRPPWQRPQPWTETPLDRDPRTVTSGLYASYWNAFLSNLNVGVEFGCKVWICCPMTVTLHRCTGPTTQNWHECQPIIWLFLNNSQIKI